MNILEKIIATKRREISILNQNRSYADILSEAQSVERVKLSFSDALIKSDTKIIAEFKRRSPSKGFFCADANVAEIVGGYSSLGAAAISVLTDSEYFSGAIDDMVEARKVSAVPLLFKDFIIDPVQICAARIAGADVVLLIAAAMSNPAQCEQLARFARLLNLEVLLEIHNEKELNYLNSYVNVVGVNNRDLTTFVTDVSISLKLGALIPNSFVKISESGISSPNTVKQLRQAGFQGFLMGENFMKNPRPTESFKQFLSALQR
ncbi:MAG: indole-3-glycerol phosphate synthase TrpC [Prevotellaceae bacterium]|jgi:indole-3-glycerol phosphate synthase|nr:indole-3-glycerol phosphate synthase TrpC [Prevotellaceae bacterium]